MTHLTYLSLFTGAGGGDLAMQHLLGFKCKGYVEYENYCQEVIKQRITDGLLDSAPIFGDIRAFISEGYAASYQGLVDVITGGFPCPDVDCDGVVEYETTGYWQCSKCSFRTKHIENSNHRRKGRMGGYVQNVVFVRQTGLKLI